MIRDLAGNRIDPPQPIWSKAAIQMQKWLEPAHLSKQMTLRCNAFHDPNSRKWIPFYAKQYRIDRHQIANCETYASDAACWASFDSLNAFFTRVRTGLPRIVRTARPQIVSPADAYTIYLTAQHVRDKFWIKGTHMSLEELFASRVIAPQRYHMYIFRLAPHHYHRFHAPVHGYVVGAKRIGTEYFSVDPIVVRSRLNVYTRNVRVILQIETVQGSMIFLAIIGATCVGSVVLSHPKLVRQFQRETRHNEMSDRTLTEHAHRFRKKIPIRLHEELGMFQYGGSTIVMCLPWEECVPQDSVLAHHSSIGCETEIQVGHPLMTLSRPS